MCKEARYANGQLQWVEFFPGSDQEIDQKSNGRARVHNSDYY